MNTHRETERQRLIRRAAQNRQGILEIYEDAVAWNRIHPTEEPIDPDPDGEMLAALLKAEEIIAFLTDAPKASEQ